MEKFLKGCPLIFLYMTPLGQGEDRDHILRMVVSEITPYPHLNRKMPCGLTKKEV
jgi:hypothetical protein